jgi:hypothetical protein
MVGVTHPELRVVAGSFGVPDRPFTPLHPSAARAHTRFHCRFLEKTRSGVAVVPYAAGVTLAPVLNGSMWELNKGWRKPQQSHQTGFDED